MNTIVDTVVTLLIGIGTGGGIAYIYTVLRDLYYERKWAKALREDPYMGVSMEELKRILDRHNGD